LIPTYQNDLNFFVLFREIKFGTHSKHSLSKLKWGVKIAVGREGPGRLGPGFKATIQDGLNFR
jgi:hypothetical protein